MSVTVDVSLNYSPGSASSFEFFWLQPPESSVGPANDHTVKVLSMNEQLIETLQCHNDGTPIYLEMPEEFI